MSLLRSSAQQQNALAINIRLLRSLNASNWLNQAPAIIMPVFQKH